MKQKEKTTKELRKFAAVMTVIPGALALFAWYRGRMMTAEILGAVAVAFAVAGVLFPRQLAVVEKKWLAFGELLGRVVTPLILTVAYILILTPFGLLIRLLGKDLLEVKVEKSRESYWREVESDGPGTRPFLPY